MAADLGSAYLQIVPSMKGFGSSVAKELGGASGSKAGAAVGTQFGSGFKGAITGLAGLAVVGLGVSKLTGYLKDSFAAVANWGAINAQSASVVKATGAAAGVTAAQVHTLATTLEGQTSTQAEAIQSGANMLLTFKNIRNEAGKGNDVFNQSTKTLVDMSRAMGTDPQQAAIQLGKALNDPIKGISALSRVGVTFSDQQKSQIKSMVASGHTMAAQKVILAELNSEFGGSGAAYRATFAGQMYQLGDAVGDFGESIVTAALPALTALVGTAAGIANWANDSNIVGKSAAAIGTAFTAAGPPVRAFITGLTTGNIGTVAPQFAGIASAGNILRGAFTGIWAAIKPLIPSIVTMVTSLSPLSIIFKSLGPVLPQLAVSLAQVAAALGQGLSAAVTALAPALITIVTVLSQLLVPVLSSKAAVIALAAAFLTWKIATTGIAFAGIIAGLIQTSVQLAVNTAGWIRNAVAVGLQAAGWVASTTAMVAARVAMVAGAVATGIATAAQWALNAALTANPIGIVVVAIAALVAALIWFFTQTKVGQQIWAGFVAALQLSWQALSAGIQVVVGAFANGWNQIVTGVRTVWNNLVGFLKTWGPGILAVLVPVVGIPLLIAQHWNQIVAIAKSVWAAVVSFVTAYVNRLRSTITAVVNGLVAFWTGAWNRLVALLRAAWNLITSAVRTGVNNAINVVKTLPQRAVAVLSGLGRTLFNSGKALINGFIGGIRSMIGNVAKVASDVVGTVAKFFPHSPAKEGPLSGKGYTTHSGKALALDFASGMASGIRPVRIAASGLTSAAALSGATAGIASSTAVPAGSAAGAAGFPGKVTLIDRNGSLLGHMDARIDRYDLTQQLAGAR